MDSKELGYERVNRINLAHGREQWHAIVYILMDRSISKREGESLDYLRDIDLTKWTLLCGVSS
jgi:hypothetical protein